VELEFFRALSLLKSKDSRIYDKEKTKFFENMAQADDEEEGGEEARREKKRSKPYQLKDLEREMVMEKVERAERVAAEVAYLSWLQKILSSPF
jgi:protein KRI1